MQASIDFPSSSFFLLLDSDAAVSTTQSKTGDRWSDRPLEQILTAAAGWPNARSDVLVNQADRALGCEKGAAQTWTRWRRPSTRGRWRGKEIGVGPSSRPSADGFVPGSEGPQRIGHRPRRAWPQDQYGLNMAANSRELDDVAVVPMDRKYAADYATYKPQSRASTGRPGPACRPAPPLR